MPTNRSTPTSLFSYGTLQQPAVQLELFGRQVEGEPDRLPGYRRGTVTLADPEGDGPEVHAIAIPSGHPADEIAGTLLRLTEAELAAADAYEPDAYRREMVTMRSGRRAWAYVQASPVSV